MSPPLQAWSSPVTFSSGRSLASMTDVEAFILALEDPVSKFFVNFRVSNQEDMTMRKRLTPGIVATVFATVLIFGVTTRLDAQDRCTNASLKGSYAFKVDGTNVSNPYLPLGPFAAVGKNTYDGRGHMKGVIIVSSNGATIPATDTGTYIPATYTGTYTVNSNCTGFKSATLSIGAVVDFFFVIDDDLREIQMVVTQAGPPGGLAEGLTVSGAARKVPPEIED